MGLESKGVQTKSDKSSKGSRRESASGGFSRVFGGGVSKSRSKESKNQNGRRTNLDKTGGSGVGHNKSPVIQYPTLPPRFSSPTGPYYAEKVNLPRRPSINESPTSQEKNSIERMETRDVETRDVTEQMEDVQSSASSPVATPEHSDGGESVHSQSGACTSTNDGYRSAMEQSEIQGPSNEVLPQLGKTPSQSTIRPTKNARPADDCIQPLEHKSSGDDSDRVKMEGRLVELQRRLKDIDLDWSKGEERIKSLLFDLNRQRELLQQKDTEIKGLEDNLKGAREALADHEQEIKNLEEEISKLHEQKDLEIKINEERISKLSSAIAHLTALAPSSKKDDEYFLTQFANLSRDIEGWAFKHFIGPVSDQEEPISDGFRNYLTTWIPNWESLVQTHKLLLIQSVIGRFLHTHIFNPFLLGLEKDGQGAAELYNQLESDGGTRTGWRIKTVESFTSTTKYKEQLKEVVLSKATMISKGIKPLASVRSKEGQRTKLLTSVLMQAAELMIQCKKEPSEFLLKFVPYGHPCLANFVLDAAGAINEAELEAQGALVRLVVFPAVFRRAVNGEEELIAKAKVLAEVPGSRTLE